MKLKTKILIGILALCGAACTVAACAKDEAPYKNLNKQGYTVSVKYDTNGGIAVSNENVNFVHVYSLSDQKTTTKDDGKEYYEITLLQPSSDTLEDGMKKDEYTTTVYRTGYFLAGWYSERTPRVDANGNALDEDGNLCSVSGKEQGYEYSGLWDFSTEKLYVEADKSYSSSSPVLTLYAGWIPEYTYTIMAQLPESEGSSTLTWQEVASIGTSGKFNLLTDTPEIELPSWNEETGAQDINDFKTLTDKTFLAAYEDEACTKQYTGTTIAHTGTYSKEKGISIGGDLKIYTTWRDGTWYHITTAQQLYKNGRVNGCYEIYADLDFTGVSWPNGLSNGSFTGKIVSMNGSHTISNVTATQTDNTRFFGGLFGELSEGAVIENISFENVSYQVIGCRYQGASFGLLAGNISEGATLTNVTVSGKLIISRDACTLYFQRNTSLGLLSGNGVTGDISLASIEYELPTDDPNWSYSAKVEDSTGAVTLDRDVKQS